MFTGGNFLRIPNTPDERRTKLEYDSSAVTMIGPEQERRRLAEVYAAQSDGELEQVAAQMSDLTDIARETLRVKLAKRGLYVGQLEPDMAPNHDDAEVQRSYYGSHL